MLATPPARRSSRLKELSGTTKGSAPAPSHAVTAEQTPRRRRLRSRDCALEELASAIVSGTNVVFITGAGLSVASGIQPFRSGRPWNKNNKLPVPTKKRRKQGFVAASDTGLQEGLWDHVLWTTATRQSFREDPTRWYREFWWPHFAATQSGMAAPNAGHEAMQELLSQFPSCRQITQNIDGLQTDPSTDANQRLIEIHGRVGLYKCMPDSDSDTDSDSDEEDDRPVHLGHRRKTRLLRARLQDSKYCPYQFLESLSGSEVIEEEAQENEENSKTSCSGTEDIDKKSRRPGQCRKLPPRCPICLNIAMPQALLFDEGYHSHSFYQFELAEDWLRDCKILVFCGTSFAVRLTSVALEHARMQGLSVYNFNLNDSLPSTARLNASNVIGPAHETLPQLVEACHRLRQEKGNNR